MSERIGITVELFGAERAEQHLRDVDKLVNSLNGKKLKLAMDDRLAKMKADLRAIQNAKIHIRLKKDSRMADFKNEINSLTRKKHEVQVDITKAKRKIMELREALSGAELHAATAPIYKQMERDQQRMREINDEINKTRDNKARVAEGYDSALRKAEQSASRLKMAMEEIKNMDITPRLNMAELYRKVSTFQRNLGSAMQSLGNGLAKLTSPINTLMRGTAYAAAYKGLNKFTEGISGAFERYDIMEKYPKLMKRMGVSTSVTANIIGKNMKKAKDDTINLYKAVLGLPTGLDTIIEAQQQYFIATKGNYKDMNKAAKRAAKIAIAANNAFVAGGADETQVRFGQRQIRDLLSKGTLRDQEWESLMAAAPLAISEIQKKLGVTRSELKAGKVDAEKFVDALVEVGTGNGPVAQAAQEMKHTFSAVSSNVTNALRNAGYQTIKVLDAVFKAYNGKDVIDNLLMIKPQIEKISESLQNWIKANPDKIKAFFKDLKSIDVVGLLKGLAQGFSTVVGLIAKVSSVLSKLGGENIGKWLVYTNLLAKGLTAFGGIIRGTAGLGGGFAAGTAFFGSKLINFFKTTETASKLAKIGIIERITSFFSRFKKVEKAAETATASGGLAKTTTALEKTGEATANMAVSFKQIGANLLKAVSPAITAATYIGTIWLGVKAIADIGKTKINWSMTVSNLTGAGIALTAMSGLMKGLSAIGLLGGTKTSLIRSAVASLEAVLSAGVFTLVAKLLGAINKVKLGKGFFSIHAKIAQIGIAIAEMQAFMIGLGALNAIPGVTILDALGSISAILTSSAWIVITKSLNKIGSLKVPSKGKIKKVGEAIKTLQDNLLDEGIWSGFKKSLAAMDLKDNMEDIAESLGYVEKSLGKINNIAGKLETLSTNYISRETLSKVAMNMNQIKYGMEAVFNAIGDYFYGESRTGGGSRMGGAMPSGSRFEKYNEMLKNVTRTFKNFKSLANQIKNIKSSIGSVMATYGEGKGHNRFLNVDAIKADIGQIVEVVNAIAGENGLGKLTVATEKLQGINLDTVTSQLKKIPALMKELGALKAQLGGSNWLNPISKNPMMLNGGEKAFSAIAPGSSGIQSGTQYVYSKEIQGMLDTVRNIATVMTQIAGELNKIPDMTANANMLKKSVGTLTETLSSMNALAAAGQAVNKGGIADATSAISTYISKIGAALATAPLMLVNAGMFKMAVALTQSALASITSGGKGSATAFASALRKIPGAINSVTSAMRGKGKEWKSQLVDGFKGTAEKVKAEIDKIKSAIAGISFYSQGYSAGLSWANGFNAGASNARVPSVAGGGAATSSGNRVMNAVKKFFTGKTGGLITDNGIKHMRGGGLIGQGFPGQPKGIDRVPVWAANGEYMMRREAVKKLGVPFMQRLNHLDIKGAMKSLYMRGGELAYATPSITIDRSVHKIYNNNQQVHLTNNNASQGYSESRASRYIRSL